MPEVPQSEIAALSPLQLFWRRFRADKVALAAGAFVVLLVFMAIFAPLIVKLFGTTGPTIQNPDKLDSFGTPTGPSSDHIFGVDTLGRDVFARVLYGARVSLQVALIATAISVVIGVITGMHRRLLPRLEGHRALALRRRAARVSDPAARARDRLRLLREGRLPRRHDRARPDGRDLRDRVRQLDLHLPDHQRSGDIDARAASSWRRRARWGPRTGGSSSARSCPTWSRRSSSTARL